MLRTFARLQFLVFFIGLGAVSAQEIAAQFYQSIRNNDLSALQTLLKTSDVNTRDSRETTPIMWAAAYGTLDAMNMLIGAGADVNAKNAFDATALHWCAGDLNKVRLLVEKGANVNAVSKMGRTPLLIAAAHSGGSPVVEFLLSKGARAAVMDKAFNSPLSVAAHAGNVASVRALLEHGVNVGPKDIASAVALMNAADNGHAEIVKILIEKGANVNATSPPDFGTVKNGPIALGTMTPLLFASPYGGAGVVRLLLDAGANVNVQEKRGMTPLILAVASDHPDPKVIKMLLAKGADPKIKDKNGENTFDWAKKFNNPAVLEALGVPKTAAAPNAVFVPAGESKITSKQAVEKSIPLLQRTSGSFFTEGGCVACHAQNLAGMTIAAVERNGFKVDTALATEEVKALRLQWTALEQPLLQRGFDPEVPEIMSFSLLQMAAERVPADRSTDAMIHDLASLQQEDGSWHFGFTARPPMEDGDIGRTATGLRSLQLYGFAGRRAEFEERIRRAAAWLDAAVPLTTEDRVMQLLGIKWATGKTPAGRLTSLVALQRPDGGWGQTADLASDAYATGEVLSALHDLGMPAGDSVYRHGVEFLLKTQLADGSWHVSSRAPKFQPYFQSGFPHNHDQWISAAATAWATIALSNCGALDRTSMPAF